MRKKYYWAGKDAKRKQTGRRGGGGRMLTTDRGGDEI